MIVKQVKGENRTPSQVREHYEVEKELAAKLRNASKQERTHLYSSLYAELYERLPHHPQLARKSLAERREEAQLHLQIQMGFLRHFLQKDTTFLEIGAGDCSLSLEVADSVRRVYAVDVSEKLTQNLTPPKNFQLILSPSGCTIPLPSNSVDVAYSNSLIEHLHPEDAFEQLQDVHRVLASGGIYICVTPHRLSGPHDVSRYFDASATGFHLKEYTIAELNDTFKQAGFSKAEVYAGGRGRYVNAPMRPAVWCERLVGTFPQSIRRSLLSNLPLRVLFGIRIVGTK
jgi:ubiquinone/menaquinone biosynthesis C-methylase UbiE